LPPLKTGVTIGAISLIYESSPPPIGSRPIHVVKRLFDSSLFAEIVDGSAAPRQNVIVDDDESAARDPSIQRLQCLHRRPIHVAVKTQDGELLDRGLRQRVLEPARQEGALLVEQPKAVEVVLQLI
jgi:hypothetical protein